MEREPRWQVLQRFYKPSVSAADRDHLQVAPAVLKLRHNLFHNARSVSSEQHQGSRAVRLEAELLALAGDIMSELLIEAGAQDHSGHEKDLLGIVAGPSCLIGCMIGPADDELILLLYPEMRGEIGE